MRVHRRRSWIIAVVVVLALTRLVMHLLGWWIA